MTRRENAELVLSAALAAGWQIREGTSTSVLVAESPSGRRVYGRDRIDLGHVLSQRGGPR